MGNKKLRTVVYYRVSKRSKNGIRMQRKACRNFHLKERMGRVREYVDLGFSGKSKNRPALGKLLKDIEKGKVDRVLIYSMDRLGRDFIYLNEVVGEFNRKNVQLVSIKQNSDSFTSEGRLSMKVFSFLAEVESDMVSMRTIDGLRAAGKL
jgi:site-specific DNA recombinase